MKTSNNSKLLANGTDLIIDADLDSEGLQRLESPKVGYMEIGGTCYNCGGCKFQKDGYCANTEVQAQVSPEHGCCNLFLPKTGQPVDPQKWQAQLTAVRSAKGQTDYRPSKAVPPVRIPNAPRNVYELSDRQGEVSDFINLLKDTMEVPDEDIPEVNQPDPPRNQWLSKQRQEMVREEQHNRADELEGPDAFDDAPKAEAHPVQQPQAGPGDGSSHHGSRTVSSVDRIDDAGLLFRGMGQDEAIKIAQAGTLVYYSRDPMSKDWEVIEYGIGDEAGHMTEDEIGAWIKDRVYWKPMDRGVNLTSDFQNAKGYGEYVACVRATGDTAEFSASHVFAKEPADCQVAYIYDVKNRKYYTPEEFIYDGPLAKTKNKKRKASPSLVRSILNYEDGLHVQAKSGMNRTLDDGLALMEALSAGLADLPTPALPTISDRLRRLHEMRSEDGKDHSLMEKQASFLGDDIQALLNPQPKYGVYADKVFNCLMNIFQENQGISEKDFKRMDALHAEIEEWFVKQGVSEVCVLFEANDNRPEMCAEAIIAAGNSKHGLPIIASKKLAHTEADIQSIIEDADGRGFFADDATETTKRKKAVEFLDDIEKEPKVSSKFSRTVLSASAKDIYDPLKDSVGVNVLTTETKAFLNNRPKAALELPMSRTRRPGAVGGVGGTLAFASIIPATGAEAIPYKEPVIKTQGSRRIVSAKPEDLEGFVTNIEDDTIENENFRKVLYTGENSQLVLMSLKPGEDIGSEVHEDVDQFFRIDGGTGEVVINGHTHKIENGSAVVVPAGAEHNVINTSKDEDLKLYTVYSPANHRDGLVEKTKEQAENTEEHFEGQTTE